MFTDVFNQILQSKNITAYKLSQETGITQGMISYWKKGDRLPSAECLVVLADYFGVSVDYLLGNIDNPSPDGQKEKPPAQGGEQDAEVQELIRLFDLATPELRAAALAVLRSAEAVQKARGDAGGKK